MNQELLAWFRRHSRVLPWRKEPRDPYHVLVSEIMLQQTQVDRVVPRFIEFIALFPTLGVLAAASEEEVLASWSGLGYYRRARMLHRLAREVSGLRGKFPTTVAELQRLPGIGPYTAAAVASLAFGEEAPVLDGNVMRVAARVLALAADPRLAEGQAKIRVWVCELMDGCSPGEVNEALMELGAVVCSPKNPDCEDCPLETGCQARREGLPEAYPPARSRRAVEALNWVAACCVDNKGRWLLRRIDQGPILRGLWLPPLEDLKDGADPVVCARRMLPKFLVAEGVIGSIVRHNITHRKIEVLPVLFEAGCKIPAPDGWRWTDPYDSGFPTSSLLAKCAKALQS